MHIQEIPAPYRDEQTIRALTALWKASVQATHHFLTDDAIVQLLPYVENGLRQIAHLLIAKDRTHGLAGFMGIAGHKAEMLFLAPYAQGRGLGRQLMEVGIRQYQVAELCVNEQNPQARRFYERLGFQVYKRAERDEQGNPYPILYMKL